MEIKVNPNIQHDLLHWLGQKIVCKIIITDIKNEKYESEIHLPEDWNTEKFQECITKSFLLCENTPKETFIDYIGPDLELMN